MPTTTRVTKRAPAAKGKVSGAKKRTINGKAKVKNGKHLLGPVNPSPDPDHNVFDDLLHVHLTDWSVSDNSGAPAGTVLAGAVIKVNDLPPLHDGSPVRALLAYVFRPLVPAGSYPHVAGLAPIGGLLDATVRTTTTATLDELRVVGLASIGDWRSWLAADAQGTAQFPQWLGKGSTTAGGKKPRVIILGISNNPGDGNGKKPGQ